MQISPKHKCHCFAVLLAATTTLSQPLLASANNAFGLGNSNAIIAGVSSPNLQKDDVLYRPRWSLPPNGALQKLPLKNEDPDDDPIDTTETKTADPKTETPTKVKAGKRPAISRSERLNLDQTTQTSEDSKNNVAPEIKSATSSREKTAQPKHSVQTETQKVVPNIQAPAPGSVISAPLPGAL